MLRGLILCPDPELSSNLEQALLKSRAAAVVATLNRYPDIDELQRLVHGHAVEVVFLSFQSQYQFVALAGALEKKIGGAPVVAVAAAYNPAALLELMRAGVRELLVPPFEESALREALGRIAELLDVRARTIERLFAFLPSKAGVGASTVALNTSVALSHLPETSVLLMDFDLNSGVLGFMLKLNGRYSILDAVEHAHKLDQDIWAKLVWPVGKLDILPAGPMNPGIRIDPQNLQPLLNFARRHYRVISVDLSGMMEKYSVELLREAGRILMVTSPEIPALHIGAEKLKYLRGLDLGSRLEVLVNRMPPRGVLSREEIERMLGAPVRITIPNDYTAVHDAMVAGRPLDESSRLGKRFEELARSLMEIPGAPAAPRKRRLLEYLSPSSAAAE